MSVSNEIIKVLDAIAEKFGLAIDWTAENVIPYLEQLCGKYINYEIVTSIIWFVLGLILIVLGFVFIKSFNKYYDMSKDTEKYYSCQRDEYETMAFIYGILIILCFLFGIGIALEQMFDVATCLTFPEKMLIEEIKSIYDSMK